MTSSVGVLFSAIWITIIFQVLMIECMETVIECPPEFGTCNKCVEIDGKTVLVTRKVCGEFTFEKCTKLYNGPGGLCDDGCNTCWCYDKGMYQTWMGCGRYNKEFCEYRHPEGKWKCGEATCYCTDSGIGTSSG